MKWVIQTGGTQVVQLTFRSMLGRFYQSIENWIRRQIIKFRIYTLGYPERQDIKLYEPSAAQSIKDYFNSKQSGITVFWAPAYAGKSATLNLTNLRPDCICIYVDFKTFHSEEDKVVHFLHGKLGLNDHRCALSAFLPNDVAFITIVLDHFEVAIDGSQTDALNLIRELSSDSQMGNIYNVLVLTKKAEHAQLLLRSSLGRLLGPRSCGRWTDWPGEQRENIVACGTLLPICCRLSEPRMQLEIARLNKEWEHGEQLLAGYRDEFMV